MRREIKATRNTRDKHSLNLLKVEPQVDSGGLRMLASSALSHYMVMGKQELQQVIHL